jgi:hypothetical protein
VEVAMLAVVEAAAFSTIQHIHLIPELRILLQSVQADLDLL